MFEVVFKDSGPLDFQALSAQFLKSLDVKSSSRYTYQRQLREFLSWLFVKSGDFGQRQAKKKTSPSAHPELVEGSSGKTTVPVNLKREDILDYKDYLKNDKNLSSLTVAGYLTAVRKFFEWLETEQIYPNITKNVKNPKRKRGFKKDALTPEHVNKILGNIKTLTLTGKRDYAIFNLMIRTGMRTIEIARANREDVTTQSGSSLLWVHGKGRDSKDEMVLLTQKALEPILDYIKARGRVRDEDPLFISHSTRNFGKPLTTRSVSRIIKNRLKAAGFDDARLTAHSLRHTAITLSLLAGATPQEARAMARHADINTTMIYAHNINRIEQAPERKIDTLLD